uniref:hypothetical protein n=1 Tax=Clostridium sp. NkU-1 TaxID=1095009 RepID=UPI0032619FE8
MSEYSNGSIIYGNIETLFGIGGVLGAVLITTLGVGDKIGRSFKIGVSLSYLGMLIICYQRFVWVSGFGVIIFTIANQIMDACSQAWWQTNVPITKQGRFLLLEDLLFGYLEVLELYLLDFQINWQVLCIIFYCINISNIFISHCFINDAYYICIVKKS